MGKIIHLKNFTIHNTNSKITIIDDLPFLLHKGH